MNIDKRFQEAAYAALRIVAGFMFTFHGVQKIFGLLATHPQPAMWSQMWFGGVIELVGGVLIAIGLVTRPAAVLAAGTMAVAYFQFHWKLELAGGKFLPIVNGGELAALYCFVFLMFAVGGGRRWSIDHSIGRA